MVVGKTTQRARYNFLSFYKITNVALSCPVQFRARSHTGDMDYDETFTCIMYLAPGMVHNFPKAVGV